MALVFVGKASTGGTTAALTLPLTGLTGGSSSSAQAGDLAVVVAAQSDNTDFAMAMNTAGFVEDAELWSNDTRQCNMGTWHKILTSTDISTGSVEVKGSNDSQRGETAILHVWRNVDPTTPIDVAVQSATGINSALADPPAITPATAGAVIIICTGSSSDSTPNAFDTPGDRSNFVQETAHGGSNRGGVATVGSVAWTSGAFDPAALTGGESTAFDSWAAVTLAIRPAAEAGSVSLPPRPSLRPYMPLIGR